MDIISWGIKLGHTTFAKGGGGREKEKLISVAHIFAQYFSLPGDVKHFLLLSERKQQHRRKGQREKSGNEEKETNKKGLLSVQQQGPSVPDTMLFFPLVVSVYAERETLEVAEKRKYRGEKQFKTLFLLRPPPVLWRPYSSVSPLVTGPHARAPQAVPR